MTILICALSALLLFGCSKQNSEPKSLPPRVQAPVSEELPVLEQNKMHLANRAVQLPDYSFHPIPDESPAEEATNPPPAVD